MANVRAVETKGEKAALLVMDDDTRVWTPEFAKAAPLVGKPIPADWTQKQGEFGPQAFPPREKSGKAFSVAHRNTKEGQEYEQEAMDRRTALMQAVIAGQGATSLADAELFYQWLRKTKTSPVAVKSAKGEGAPAYAAAVGTPSPAGGTSSEPHGRGAQSAGEEPGSTNGEVAAPAPSGSTIDAQTVKDLQAVLGGPTNALHAARARFGDSVYALKNLTTEQAKALLP